MVKLSEKVRVPKKFEPLNQYQLHIQTDTGGYYYSHHAEKETEAQSNSLRS